MKPRLLLYILLALAGAVCLYSGLKIHRHIQADSTAHNGPIVADETAHNESLTVGLAGSPLYTREKREQHTSGSDDSKTEVISLKSSWHPVSASALLAVVGLVLLLAAGRLRKAGS